MSQVLAAGGRLAAAPRRRKRRSRLLDVLRIALPAVVLLLIGLVVAWPQLMGSSDSLTVPIFDFGESDETSLLRMDGPRYVGQTERERPYEITATSASFDPLEPHVILLDRPAANVALGEDGDARLTALSGVYNRNTDKLALNGGIEVITSAGYRFATPSAQVDLTQGRVVGSQAITGSGPSGKLTAERFEIRDAGDVLRFEGRVKVTLPPSPERDTSSAENAPLTGRGRSS